MLRSWLRFGRFDVCLSVSVSVCLCLCLCLSGCLFMLRVESGGADGEDHRPCQAAQTTSVEDRRHPCLQLPAGSWDDALLARASSACSYGTRGKVIRAARNGAEILCANCGGIGAPPWLFAGHRTRDSGLGTGPGLAVAEVPECPAVIIRRRSALHIHPHPHRPTMLFSPAVLRHLGRKVWYPSGICPLSPPS